MGRMMKIASGYGLFVSFFVSFLRGQNPSIELPMITASTTAVKAA